LLGNQHFTRARLLAGGLALAMFPVNASAGHPGPGNEREKRASFSPRLAPRVQRFTVASSCPPSSELPCPWPSICHARVHGEAHRNKNDDRASSDSTVKMEMDTWLENDSESS
jgi:hypothetical protein